MKRAAPVIITCLVLLKLGLVATGVPIPIPGLSEMLGEVSLCKQYLDTALLTMGASSDSEGVVQSCIDDTAAAATESDVSAGAAERFLSTVDDAGSEGTRDAYEAIHALLQEVDPHLSHAGVQQVTFEGKTAWIKKDDSTLISFKQHHGERLPPVAAQAQAQALVSNTAGVSTSAAGGGGGGVGAATVVGGQSKKSVLSSVREGVRRRFL